MANEYLDGSRALLPTYRAAISYVETLDDQLLYLEKVVDRTSTGPGRRGIGLLI